MGINDAYFKRPRSVKRQIAINFIITAVTIIIYDNKQCYKINK